MRHYDQRGTNHLLLQQYLGHLYFQKRHDWIQRSSKTEAKYIESTTESKKLLCSTVKNVHFTKGLSKVVNLQGWLILKADGIILHDTGKPYFIRLLLSQRKGTEFPPHPQPPSIYTPLFPMLKGLGQSSLSMVRRQPSWPGAGDPSRLLSCITEQTGDNHRIGWKSSKLVCGDACTSL